VSTVRARTLRRDRRTPDEDVLVLASGRLALVLAEGWRTRQGPGNCRVCRGWTAFITTDGKSAHPLCIAPFASYDDWQTEQQLRALDAQAVAVALPPRDEQPANADDAGG
jgi:hypothetical protein